MARHQERVADGNRLDAIAVDWHLLVDMASRHGLRPFLRRYLDCCEYQNVVPSEVRQSLSELSRTEIIRSLLMSRELCRIHKRLRDNKIAVVPFKGPTFSEYAYDDSRLRSCGDLDFLISPKDVPQAKAILMTDGFVPEFQLSPKQEAALLEISCEYCLCHARHGLRVELHWKIVPDYASFGLGAAEIWDHLIPFEFFATEMMIPSPEYMLLVLIVHNGGKHQWEHLGLIMDVACSRAWIIHGTGSSVGGIA